MQANIAEVGIFVMACTWSRKGVAYMVSTHGKMVMQSQLYISQFEDEYGNFQKKELPCPTIDHMLYEFLPQIDECTQACQNIMDLEKVWLTKNCQF